MKRLTKAKLAKLGQRPLIDPNPCDHCVSFDAKAAQGLTAQEVRERWPRGSGVCPNGCGYEGVAYASFAHYLAGDW